MMRVLIIVAALFLGLVGLLMSLCGGGFFVTFVRQDWTIGLLAISSALVGVALMVGCAKLVQKATRKEPRDGDSQ